MQVNIKYIIILTYVNIYLTFKCIINILKLREYCNCQDKEFTRKFQRNRLKRDKKRMVLSSSAKLPQFQFYRQSTIHDVHEENTNQVLLCTFARTYVQYIKKVRERVEERRRRDPRI